jgi:hypothetical protein
LNSNAHPAVIRIKADPGKTLAHTCKVASRRASEAGKPVHFMYEGLAIRVEPGDMPKEVLYKYKENRLNQEASIRKARKERLPKPYDPFDL